MLSLGSKTPYKPRRTGLAFITYLAFRLFTSWIRFVCIFRNEKNIHKKKFSINFVEMFIISTKGNNVVSRVARRGSCYPKYPYFRGPISQFHRTQITMKDYRILIFFSLDTRILDPRMHGHNFALVIPHLYSVSDRFYLQVI